VYLNEMGIWYLCSAAREMRKMRFFHRALCSISCAARTKNPIIIIILHQHLGNAAAAIHYISAAQTFVRRLFILLSAPR